MVPPPTGRNEAEVMDLRKKNLLLAAFIAGLALMLYVFAIFQVIGSKSAH
jgi:hypothetical protein